MPRKICTIAGCSRRYRARGRCQSHYDQALADGEFSVRVRRYEADAVCSVDECERRPDSEGMCSRHRRVFLKHGDPTADKRRGCKVPWQDRFWDKIYPCAFTGCWHWGGAIYTKRGGYGSFNKDGKPRKAHVIAYEHFVGPVPDGLVLDHTCRVTCCVNPDHLEPVTLAENTRRAMSPTMLANKAGTCLSGLHEMTPDNVYIRPDTGQRWCRKCATIRNSRRAAKERETRQAAPWRVGYASPRR